jgi:hypothetical protein
VLLLLVDDVCDDGVFWMVEVEVEEVVGVSTLDGSLDVVGSDSFND